MRFLIAFILGLFLGADALSDDAPQFVVHNRMPRFRVVNKMAVTPTVPVQAVTYAPLQTSVVAETTMNSYSCTTGTCSAPIPTASATRGGWYPGKFFGRK